MVYSVHAFLYTLGIMSNQKYISVEEALDWLANVAAADGLIVQSERSAIKSFADSYHINADDIIEKASKALSGVKPEVEIIDSKQKIGCFLNNLLLRFSRIKNVSVFCPGRVINILMAFMTKLIRTQTCTSSKSSTTKP